jgi:phage N-6-adenine-methyltransferase
MKEEAAKKRRANPGGPRITKGGQSGDYETDHRLVPAIEKKFGKIIFDLAATAKNSQADRYYSEEEDSLKQDWATLSASSPESGVLWLNPPYTHVKPWLAKCVVEASRGANIVALVPAAVGSKWFRDNVMNKCDVYFLRGRLMFEGHTTVYPKDCMVLHYRMFDAAVPFAIRVWQWKKEIEREDEKEISMSAA